MPDEPLQTFESGEQAFLLAKAIVDTVREPLLVLDEDLRNRCCEPLLLSNIRDDATGDARA